MNYEQLQEELNYFTESGAAEWVVKKGVFQTSQDILGFLKENKIPSPEILGHGPNSLVFVWENSGKTLYFTVTQTHISILVSNPERVELRSEVAHDNLEQLLHILEGFMTQFYLGVKQVTAWPQEKEGAEGYAVKYSDGYISWSPKDVFERAYMPMRESSDGTRITPEMVDDFMDSGNLPETIRLGNHAVSRIVLRNGFSLVEESACVSAENYDEKVGEALNLSSAKSKVWNLLGFLLATARNGIALNE